MSHANDATPTLFKPTARSKVTNARLSGKRLSTRSLLNSDGRSAWARRYRDLTVMLADDLGGASSLSELKLGLVRRVAALTIEAERLEVRLAEGDQTVDIDALGRVSGHIRRISETLGLDRVSRDVTPTIADIVARHQREAAEKAAQSPKPSGASTTPGESLSRTRDASPPHDDTLAESEAAE
jgi:hypothetical protein